MNRTVLYYIAAFLWGTPGVIIAIKGIKMYLSMPSEDMWGQCSFTPHTDSYQIKKGPTTKQSILFSYNFTNSLS